MINIAILGFGVVGSGVAQVLTENAQMLKERTADQLNIKYILDLRDFPDSPFGDKHVKDFSIIDSDPDVQIIVEVMGGSGAAYHFTKASLEKGRSVVTSNKELVAQHGAQLLAIAKENNTNYLFEASVGGGIPIIKALNQCLAANRIEEIYGILNGTTNYILTKMIKDGFSFDIALKNAQQLGYAEADPTADVKGLDAGRKISILASLATGRHVYPDNVPTAGITTLSAADVTIAKRLGRVIKLLGRAIITPEDKVNALVAPFLILQEHPLAAVEDVFNAIMVRGNAIGECMFYGQGAGKLPTASAVVADVIDAAKHTDRRLWLDWTDPLENIMDDGEHIVCDVCLRLSNKRQTLPDVVAAIKEVFNAEYDIVSFESDDFYAFIIKNQSQKTLQARLDALQEKGVALRNCLRLL